MLYWFEESAEKISFMSTIQREENRDFCSNNWEIAKFLLCNKLRYILKFDDLKVKAKPFNLTPS